MKNKFRTIFIISVLLVLPFLIKTIDFKLEIFPSVILPSHSDKIKTNRDVNLVKLELYGIDISGHQKKLNQKKFFKNIPVKYSPWIIRNNFGLNQKREVIIVSPNQ